MPMFYFYGMFSPVSLSEPIPPHQAPLLRKAHLENSCGLDGINTTSPWKERHDFCLQVTF